MEICRNNLIESISTQYPNTFFIIHMQLKALCKFAMLKIYIII